jgi:hypothetical protein
MSSESKNLIAYLSKFKEHVKRFPDSNSNSNTLNLHDDSSLINNNTNDTTNNITINAINANADSNTKAIEIYVFPYGGVSHGKINIWTGPYEKKVKEIKKRIKNNDNTNIDNPYPNVTTTFNINTVTHVLICPQVIEEKMRVKILEKTGLTLEELQEKNVILVSFMWVCKWLEKNSIVDCTPFIIKYGSNDNNDDNDDKYDNDNNEHINKKQKTDNIDDNCSKNDSVESASNIRDCKQGNYFTLPSITSIIITF